MFQAPKASDFTRGIRPHDVKDAREASGDYFEARRVWEENLRSRNVSPQVGARRRARVGATSAPGGYCRTSRSADGGVSQTSRTGCDSPECADILGFNSLPVAGFPQAGGGVGVITATPNVVVGSGNARAFRPSALFFEGRDNAAALGVVPCLLTGAQISGIEQLVDAAAGAGITSAVFALTNEPLPIAWDDFENQGQQQLTLNFANILAAGVTLEVFGVLWGGRL